MVLDHRTILRTLKGAPLACLIALFMPDVPMPAGERWFAQRTGYTRKTCREALYTLHDLGYCEHGPRGWLLPTGWAQLPLPFLQLESPAKADLYESEGKIYPHPTTTTTTYRREQAVVAVVDISEGKNYPHGNGEGKNYPHFVDNSDLSTEQCAVLNKLREAGIGPPTCYTLARLPWMTEAYVKAHVDAGRAACDDLALVIWRMKSHDPAPDVAGANDPCAHCGRTLFDRAGRCRVCTGQIAI